MESWNQAFGATEGAAKRSNSQLHCELRSGTVTERIAGCMAAFSSETMWRSVLSQPNLVCTIAIHQPPCRSYSQEPRSPVHWLGFVQLLARQAAGWESGSFPVSKPDDQWPNRKNEFHHWRCIAQDWCTRKMSQFFQRWHRESTVWRTGQVFGNSSACLWPLHRQVNDFISKWYTINNLSLSL